MDSRDVIILALVGVGGYLLWCSWRKRPIVDAQNRAPSTTAGMIASDMTETAARTTNFGGPSISKRIFAPLLTVKQAPLLPSPTAPSTVVVRRQAAAFAP